MADANTTNLSLDSRDCLENALAQAEAMSFVAQGDDFDQWNDVIKANYLWALQEKISEARGHFRAMLAGLAAKAADASQSKEG